MRAQPRWMKWVIADAARLTVALPYQRGTIRQQAIAARRAAAAPAHTPAPATSARPAVMARAAR